MHFLMWRPFKNRAITTYGVDSSSWKTYIKLVVNHGGKNLQLVIIYSRTVVSGKYAPPFATLALVQKAGGIIRGMRKFLSRLRPPFR